MNRQAFDALCAAMPGAAPSGPGEHDSWKIAGKMFACLAGGEGRVSVKCPDVETAGMLIDAGAATKARYFHRSWVSLDLEALGEDEARHRLAVSHAAVAKGLTRTQRAALAPEGAA